MISDQNTTLAFLGADLRPSQPEPAAPPTAGPGCVALHAKPIMVDGEWVTVPALLGPRLGAARTLECHAAAPASLRDALSLSHATAALARLLPRENGSGPEPFREDRA